MFLSSEAAADLARRELAAQSTPGDPVTGNWGSAECGDPVLVHDLRKAPSYWLVPVISQGAVAGAIRVMGSGEVAAVERFRHPPQVVTGLDASQARQRAAERIASDEVLGEPRFVHDGPPGREAWLVEVLKANRPVRWIFLNASGAYERPAGTFLNAEKE
ncbi:MAG TPA: hypothetical protein VGW39_09545 [Chthoniobacterales bacterium]|nr:hypothetical protein [Chthoniobacterales bacterium]